MLGGVYRKVNTPKNPHNLIICLEEAHLLVPGGVVKMSNEVAVLGGDVPVQGRSAGGDVPGQVHPPSSTTTTSSVIPLYII